MPNRTKGILLVLDSRVGPWPAITEKRILLLAAKQGPNVLFCMPNRTKCVLLVLDSRVGPCPAITEMRVLQVVAK
jgi:hypothetical protein